MLEENQVTAKKLIEMFEAAFMEVADIEEGRFSVRGVQFPFLIGISVDAEKKRIRFTDYNPLHRITLENAAILCNEATKGLALARFYAFEYKQSLMAACQYDMSFEKGVIPFQVISNFRLFERVAGSAVQDIFKNYLAP